MKKILYTFVSLACVILILCIVLYFTGFFKKETAKQSAENQEEPKQTATTQEEANKMETFVENTQDTILSSTENQANNFNQEVQISNSYEAIASSLTRESLRQLQAGTIIDINAAGDNIMESSFYYEEIKEDIKSRIVGKSYGDNCTVPFEDLSYIRVLYYGFDEKTHIGELIVNVGIAQDIVDIFYELYEAKYPIEQMVLVDEYNADDNASMAANNTSAFNFRLVPGANHLSKHALGLAIDINPLYNPYVQYTDSGTEILPIEGTEYADRTLDCPYYIDENDLCYQAFTKRGFTWGGFWESEPDYQHFQKVLK